MSTELWIGLAVLVGLMIFAGGGESTDNKQRREEDEDISVERKRSLLLRKTKPRVYQTSSRISVNRKDVYWSSIVDRYVLAHQFAYANPDKSHDDWGGTGETVVFDSGRDTDGAKKSIEEMRAMVIEELGIDLNDIVKTEKIIETYS